MAMKTRLRRMLGMGGMGGLPAPLISEILYLQFIVLLVLSAF
jgi:hypothetical protein